MAQTNPNGWRHATLADVVELQRGYDLPAQSRVPGPYRVLTSGEGGGWHNVSSVEGPGFVVGRATNLGKPKWSTEPFWPHNTTMFAKDFKGNHPRWLFHLFEATDLSGFDSGSVQPMLNRNYISKVAVVVPPLAEQQAIAEVLAALDDKIAANIALAATSDQLARVEFAARCTGAQKSGSTYEEVATIGGGGTPNTKVAEYWEGSTPWATPTDVTRLQAPYLWRTERTISDQGLAACASPLYPAGTILMTSRATIGAFAIAQLPTAVNQGFITVQSKGDVPMMWLFHEMRSRVDEYISWANGATFLELSRGTFRKLPVRLADEQTMGEFSVLADALAQAALQAVDEARSVGAIRDALLPQLMSGKLRVRDAETIATAAGL